MMPNLNPKQMQQMMRKMGINQEDIDAFEVVIKCADKTITLKNPSVQRVNMSGSISYQISGDEEVGLASEEDYFTEDDVKTVMEQAQCTYDEAVDALNETGDLAEAILKLQKDQ